MDDTEAFTSPPPPPTSSFCAQGPRYLPRRVSSTEHTADSLLWLYPCQEAPREWRGHSHTAGPPHRLAEWSSMWKVRQGWSQGRQAGRLPALWRQCRALPAASCQLALLITCGQGWGRKQRKNRRGPDRRRWSTAGWHLRDVGCPAGPLIIALLLQGIIWQVPAFFLPKAPWACSCSEQGLQFSLGLHRNCWG